MTAIMRSGMGTSTEPEKPAVKPEAALPVLRDMLETHRLDMDEGCTPDQLAEWVDVPTEAVPRVVQADPDDDVILACAILGRADYLVTYDPHFDSPGEYQGVKIAKALPFLWTLRGGQSSEQAH